MPLGARGSSPRHYRMFSGRCVWARARARGSGSALQARARARVVLRRVQAPARPMLHLGCMKILNRNRFITAAASLAFADLPPRLLAEPDFAVPTSPYNLPGVGVGRSLTSMARHHRDRSVRRHPVLRPRSTPDARPRHRDARSSIVARAARWLVAHPGSMRIVLEGHTDRPRRPPSYN